MNANDLSAASLAGQAVQALAAGQDDAAQALNEVFNAARVTDELLQEEPGEKQVAGELKPVTTADVEVLRRRAKIQRERGAKSLDRRHDGIASVVRPVSLNERVVGSSFQRFFPVIENNIYVIHRRGQQFFNAKSLETIDATLVKMMLDFRTELQKELSAQAKQVEDLKADNPLFTQPAYTAPAATHNVQVRTPLALRIIELFEMQDKLIAGLQVLLWNNEVELKAIEDQELRLKKQIREMAKFTGRTLRSMRNKVKPADASETAEAPAAEGTPALEAAA